LWHRLRGLAATAAIVALAQPLSGCFIPNENVPAAIDIPPAYRDGPRQPDTALPGVLWWRGFGSKELSDLIEEALTSNFDSAAAVARIVQADAQSRIAGAPLLPVVDADANASRSLASNNSSRATTGPGIAVSNNRSGRTYSNLYSTSLSATYEIDFWGKNRAAQRAAEETAAATRFDREVVALTTVVSVATSYFQVLAAQDRVRIARDNLAAASRVLNLINQRFNVGTASQLDVAQQESLFNTVRASIPPLEETLRQNIVTLAVLVARTPEAVAVRGGSMARLRIPPVTPGLPSDLIGQRPDIREAEAQLASASASVYSARAAFFPSIQLTGEGGFQSAVLKTLLRPESQFFNIAAGLTQPILDGGLLMGQLDLQLGRQDELLQLYRKAIVNGFADVDRALIAVQQTALRERLQRAVVDSSRRAFDISETRLREGTIDLVTLLNTQQTLFQAQDNLALAQLDRLNAVVSLFQALGGGWQKPKPDAAKSAELEAVKP
jgi:NodT family efflux transporter outer membrane factor (OMF) lipoprotein